MSNTPRTDAEEILGFDGFKTYGTGTVPLAFARQLERELNAANAKTAAAFAHILTGQLPKPPPPPPIENVTNRNQEEK